MTVATKFSSGRLELERISSENTTSGLQGNHNGPHYNTVFNINWPCNGSQIEYLAKPIL